MSRRQSDSDASSTPDLAAEPDALPVAAPRGFLSRLNERPLLEAVDEEARAYVELRRRRDNEAIGRVIALPTLLFGFLFYALNVERYGQGKFEVLGVYHVLALAQACIVSSAIPGLLLLVLRREGWVDRAREAQLALFTGGLLVLGAGVSAERAGFVQTGMALITANLVYQLPAVQRNLFNLAATAGGIASVVLLSLSPASKLLGVIELLSLVAITTLAGAVRNRQRIMAVLAERELRLSAMTDSLTGLASRRRIEAELAQAIKSHTAASPLSLIVLDADHFKRVNDTYGHRVGDEVLRGIARLIQQRVRLVDLIGRWGGEEFVIICRKTPGLGAVGLANQLREKIAEYKFQGAGPQTASFGVAQARLGDTPQSLFERADAALYEAKRAGRNRAQLFEEARA